MPAPETIQYKNITSNSVLIEWSAIPHAAEYEIVYLDKSLTSSILNITIDELSPNTEYGFKVRGKNENGVGVWSETLTIKTLPPPLPKVEGLICIEKNGISITLEGNSVKDANSYEILFGDQLITSSTTSATINDLTPNTTYSFQVRAVNTSQKGALSDILVVKTNIFNPQTPYAKEFYEKCEGQLWLMDELELILNKQAKSLNTIESRDDFANVFAIGLANRKISGIIPKAIGELFNLEYLYLSSNNLSGALPAELYTLSKLKNLDLSQNQLSGIISESISAFTQLEVLLLHKNEFEGQLPNALGQLTKLQNLDLAYNGFEGPVPPSIVNLTDLRFLSLSDNNLTGTLPAGFSKLTQLEVLILSNNLIGGSINTIFKEIANVRLVDISNNAFGEIDKALLEQANDGLLIVIK